MHIEFTGEHFKCWRVNRRDANDNNWSTGTVDKTKLRPNPWEYASTTFSDSIIVPDDGYKITDVTFNNLMESGGEWLETGDNEYVSTDYPTLDDYNSTLWSQINAVISNITGCAFHIAKNTWVEGFKIDVTTVATTPEPEPEPPVDHLIFPDGVPLGYTLHNTDGSSIGDVIDVSQLKSISGTQFPSFALLKDNEQFNYEVLEGLPYVYVNDNDLLIAYEYDYGYGYIFNNTRTKYISSDIQPTIGDLPTATHKETIFRTVTLDRSFCTADKEDSSSIEDGTNFTVAFTADTGYIFKAEPYCQRGIDTIRGELTDSTHATITLEGVDKDLTIVAVCEKESINPQPDSGLVFTQVYNPTFSQLKEAADALFINYGTGEAINLQQYVISVHKLMIPVPTNELSEPIRFWKYNTGVASKVINQTEVKVSCGKVTVPEKWHNALDYSPYTSIRIWLPFLGFFDLSINELMRDEIGLTYTIDVLSGKALAEVWHEDTVIYRFVGTAKVEEPYYVEAGHNISQAYINGAYNMAELTPYLLLDRPQNLTPTNTSLHGQPTYRIVTIGDCSGYIRCAQVFASGMTATDEEKQEIESLLKSGVLVD